MTLPIWILVVIIGGCGLLIALLIGGLVHVGELAGKEKYDVQERLLREKIYVFETQLAWSKKHAEGLIALLREISSKWEAAYSAERRLCDELRKERDDARALLNAMCDEDENGFCGDTATVCISRKTYENVMRYVKGEQDE